jgi:hypothetical protein
MHGSVATLASSLEDLESSSESLRVVSVPADLGWPVAVTVMHTNGVDLLFVTLDTVWGTNIVSEKPGVSGLLSIENWVIGQYNLSVSNCISECGELVLSLLL